MHKNSIIIIYTKVIIEASLCQALYSPCPQKFTVLAHDKKLQMKITEEDKVAGEQLGLVD